ncbi:helix-turn-helix domain-containing protein [Cellulosilyticum sp. I15G10I2]|uniref:helix-turn-helix domain-containing protein n=1 Tax=Cellulosilyticum sp. I15G10I2 TaxID=1892843 RepID=UPI00085C9392|nr:helix-turn-helix transcriptional regulator [Cellulosilyticum sp. I15G10I2]
MKDINISKVIADKRREKGVTQEQLAVYIGVSKASVSKWETGQSYPDITFLPQLAAYFNISIDDLMGYTAQMTKENIKELYHQLSADFSRKPFNDVLAECREIIKKYYSCFPLLMQMAVLMCNHHMLAEGAPEQKGILEEAARLCIRIKNESEDVWLTKDAVSLEATCYLMLRQPQNVLELLGETIRPIANDDKGIAQAYLMAGNLTQANKVLQISIYQHLLSLVGASILLLQLGNEQFEEILNRILSVAAVFDLERLHPNSMALTYLNAAQGYSIQGDAEKALDMLQKYTELCMMSFFPYSLHGDSFFNELDSWFKEFDLGAEAPRSEEVIKESMIQGIIHNPAFANLMNHPQYKIIIKTLKSNLGGN